MPFQAQSSYITLVITGGMKKNQEHVAFCKVIVTDDRILTLRILSQQLEDTILRNTIVVFLAALSKEPEVQIKS